MRPLIVRPGEGEEVRAFGDTILFKLTGGQTGNELSIALSVTPPGGGPPPHIHHREHEMFIIDSGDVEFLIDGDWKKAPPGTVAFLPKGVPHTFRNAGETESRMWVIVAPSGFEDFFTQCASAFGAEGSPDMAKVMQVCEAHGIEILAPPT